MSLLGISIQKRMPLTCGVPQGSILGPLLFNLYMPPLGHILQNNNLAYHSYADDTQIYYTLTSNDYGPIELLCKCIVQINNWMSQNILQLNKEKTEVILFGSNDERLRAAAHLKDKALK